MKLLLINSNEGNSFVGYCDDEKEIVCYAKDFIAEDENEKKPNKLIVCLNDIKQKAGEDYSSIDSIAVTVGPGSFTGIRVGLSIAKGAAFALDKKIIPINNFEIAMQSFENYESEKIYCIIIPAKEPEYYFSIFDNRISDESGCAAEDEIQNRFSEAEKVIYRFNEPKKEFKSMLAIAKKKFGEGELFNGIEIQPLYLKDFGKKNNQNMK